MGSQLRSNAFPGFERIYSLDDTGSEQPFHVRLVLSGHEDVAITRGELRPDRPVVAKWYMGRRVPSDVIWTSYAVPILVSERVVELLTKIGAQGWSTYDVEVLGKDGESIRGYYGLAIQGRCGPIDYSKSVPVPKQFPARISLVWKGLYFDPETWDGSHLFMTAGEGGWIFVIDEVQRAFKKAKVTNVVFTPLNEKELPMIK